MFFDEGGRFGTAHLYPAQKAYILPLTRRGFFSEFTMMVNAVAFALMEQRHLYVLADGMNVTWAELFDLPLHDDVLVQKADYPVRSRISVKTGHRADFDRMRAMLLHAAERPLVKLPHLGLKISLEHLIAKISQAAFNPTSAIRKEAKRRMAELGLDGAEFYAIQVRGGDKVEGDPSPNSHGLVEGEITPLNRYMSPIMDETREPTVFVLTDDYRQIESLRAAYPQARFTTLCPPDHRGYYHAQFNSQDVAKRNDDVRYLLVQVLIANRAKLFLGPYLSNLSQFLHQLRFPRPSLSVDSASRWSPVRTQPLLVKPSGVVAGA